MENHPGEDKSSVDANSHNRKKTASKSGQRPPRPKSKYDKDLTEEMKDTVNKNDIRPKTKIIYSDKSESSVEEAMEDTPSNYNLLNGRLDKEDPTIPNKLQKYFYKSGMLIAQPTNQLAE